MDIIKKLKRAEWWSPCQMKERSVNLLLPSCELCVSDAYKEKETDYVTESWKSSNEGIYVFFFLIGDDCQHFIRRVQRRGKPGRLHSPPWKTTKTMWNQVWSVPVLLVSVRQTPAWIHKDKETLLRQSPEWNDMVLELCFNKQTDKLCQPRSTRTTGQTTPGDLSYICLLIL